MAENSKIEWTDHTFNPWWGCQKVSPACDHCYAERDAKRFAAGKVLWGVGSERRTFGDKHWEAPTKWNDAARASAKKRAAYGLPVERPRVFCASMADWLDLDAPIGEFVKLLDLVRVTPELDWLLLSKRIGNWSKRLQAAWDHLMLDTLLTPEQHTLAAWIERWLAGEGPVNVWIGSTVVNQEEADRDIPKLLAVPARVRFLSIEPMLGPVDLVTAGALFTETGNSSPLGRIINQAEAGAIYENDPLLHWVICGGESGPGARPMHPDWARSLRDQCKAAGVPFLFKQWGEWRPVDGPRVGAAFGQSPVSSGAARAWLLTDGTVKPRDAISNMEHSAYGTYIVAKTGKTLAGRLLDGVQHDGFPA